MIKLRSAAVMISILMILLSGCGVAKQASMPDDPWKQRDRILSRIKAPSFPNKDFIITDYGAVGDGIANCSNAIKNAIDDCNKKGGGRVVVPAGKYYTGPIYIKSNVNLHVQEDATLLFSTKPGDYLPLVFTRWEGVEVMNYSPLIYSYKEKNIAVTGKGILDGQATAENWWPWKGKAEYGWKKGMANQTDKGKRDLLFDMAEKGVPVTQRKFGGGYHLRPQFVQPYACENVLIEGIKIINSPMWILNPVLCNNVTISGVTVQSHGPNNDGCDPESCKDVLIKNCNFNTGDDCIAIKSGRNADGRRINIPAENIVIQNCTMADGHGGVVIGSEISGGVRNVFAEDCNMNSPELDRVLRIKTNTARGGIIENIFVRNITVGQVKEESVLLTMYYEDTGSFMPFVRNIQVKNMIVEKGGKRGIVMEGYEQSPIQDVQFVNVKINNVGVPVKASNVKNITWDNTFINGKKMP